MGKIGKGSIYFKPMDELVVDEYSLMGNSYDYDYTFTIAIDHEHTVDEMMSDQNRTAVLESIKMALMFLDDADVELVRSIEKHRGKEMELLTECSDVYFDMDFSLKEIANILKSSSILREKKTIIKCSGVFEEEYVSNLERLFKEFEDRVYFKLPLNETFISLDDFKRTTVKIKSIVERIKSFDMSPLEQVMYAYDMVRDRKFKESTASEDGREARDLTAVLFGNEIVCEGFSNELKAILDNLNIRSKSHDLLCIADPDASHRRVSVYVEDDKYGVKGVYSFDATWDSKKNDDSHLQSYRFFGLTKEQFDDFQNGKFEDLTFGNFGFDLLDVFIKYCREGNIYECPASIINHINAANSIVNGCHLLPHPGVINNPNVFRALRTVIDLEKTIKAVEELVDLFDRPLSADVLYKVLFEVRKIEYYENPQKYPFSVEEICKIVKNSRWIYDSEIDDRILFALGLRTRETQNRTQERIIEEGMDKTLALIKLTRTFRNIRDKESTNR